MRDKIREQLQKEKENMVLSLQELISIPSVLGEKKANAPFGLEVKKAFEYMLRKGEEDGFSIINIDGYGGHLQWNKESGSQSDFGYGDTMGILCHLDVVPAGEGWSYNPFGKNLVDGKIYGRGSADDKGPTIAAYYAVKALKDLGFKPSKNIRIVLGLDEETNWLGMEKYLEKVEPADFGITPDGDFPVVNGEKGILSFTIAKKFKSEKQEGIHLRKIKGGNAHNMVADWARAVILSSNKDDYGLVKEICNNLASQGFSIKTKGIGKSLEIYVEGVSAHGSTPEKGKNAISKIMEILSKLNIASDDIAEFIEFYITHIGYETEGSSLGIDLRDDVSGKTAVNVGVIELDDKSVKLKVNVRYPVTKSDEEVYSGISSVVEPYNIGIIKEAHKKPIFIDENDSFIKTLMDVYREETGDVESQPIIMGGGTYSRAMKNFVAYGGIFPGEEELAHQKDEYIKVDSLMKMSEIYANAIYRLCK